MNSFNKNQKNAFEAMINGNNIFITGPGGSGKSHVINYFVKYFKENLENENEQLFVTSSTGLSSLLINGITINQYAGIGTFDKENDYYIKRIKKNKTIRERWSKTKTLIIDEISMISATFFEKLDILAQKIRKNKNPFGGIQIILSGDFLQLPPVKSTEFCYESFSWDITIQKTFYFNEIIRQKEVSFQNVLNKIRIGIVDDEVKNTIDSCLNRKLENKDGIVPTLLFSKKDMVKKYNEEKLNELLSKDNEKYIYESKYVFSKKIKEESKSGYIELIDSQYNNIENNILMTKYSQVMLNVNMPEEGLANGSRGIIIGFSLNEYKNPIVQFLDGKILEIKSHDYKIEEKNESVIKRQIPLIHAWAITIHKAQGMSLEYIQTDIGQSIFEYGQAYVVLSRIRSLEGLSLINIDYSKIKAHPKILEFYEKLISN
jgi:ATP-dependent DNA helicase PIF1